MSAAGDFAAAMGDLDAPMFIVTCQPPDGPPAGCLVGFATQCSIDPGRFLACISRANHTHGAAGRCAALGVHVVPETEMALAELFGGETEDEEADKFARCAWHPGAHEVPVLDACPNWFVGRIADRLELGDHTGFLLDPVDAAHRPGGDELGQQRAVAIDPGHPA